MNYQRKEQIGKCTLYLGDCRDILLTLEVVEALVTDPPYGISEARNNNASRSRLAQSKDYGKSNWDDRTADEELSLAISKVRSAIIFGGNYYVLPPTSCWLVWDKMNGNNDFADCELAWTNLPCAVRKISWQWHGMIRQGNEERYHPTQKPLGVMEWCLTHIPNATQVLDPFMGSGTTGVACVKMGRSFIGIEIDEGYFDIACRRIEDAYRQADMFVEQV